ncbi:SDR family NAD(P)-dependent oxidoreductase [Streptomyces sedi]|uniref:SDR family NAD(P)-dependent oxidoreductase n=1 Tax=Streptomyces sedi TaxID=555059 RepID=A0A5C4VFV7_9ACTN|nr:SDR family NAD(P)-dependent oxidoreductase [Streptomyces sedi]TNM34326.1 SDR family NAD(P)-dependent oxidoreductase [Streptomyces sedi]
MLVAVTGGTGFVGAHSTAGILAAGHRVRLLVRDPALVNRALRPWGEHRARVSVVTCDVTDEDGVATALAGADAVLHAASVYSFDSRKTAELRRVNTRGTWNVLTTAHALDMNPIVHVSSVGALFPAPRSPLDGNSPAGRPREPYLASKAAAERIARQLQENGAPVLITYPPALLGPHDPHLGDQTTRLHNTLRGMMPIWPTGGFPLGDVRDTAALHARLFSAPPRGKNRFFGPNHQVSTARFLATLRAVTGRALPAVRLPARALVPVGLAADAFRRVWPWPVPAEYGAIYTCLCDTRVAEHAEGLGCRPRPLGETVRDTVAWLHQSGRLSDRQAGLAAMSRRAGVR